MDYATARPTALRLYAPTMVLLVIAAILPMLAGQSSIRYAMYAAPFVVLMDRIARNYVLFSTTTFALLLAATLVFLYAAIRGDSPQQFIFIFFGLYVCAFRFSASEEIADLLFYAALCIQIYLAVAGGYNPLTADIVSSYSAAESHGVPFVLSLFVAYYVTRGRYWMVLLTLLLIFVSGKRIALLAGMLGGMAAFAFSLRAYGNRAKLAFALLAYGLCGAIATTTPYILMWLESEFRISANLMSMGRFVGQRLAFEYLGQMPLDQLSFGSGLGTADRLAQAAWKIENVPVHNDYLRMLIDSGSAGLVLMCALYCSLFWRSPMYFAIIAITSVLWISDNVLTYTFFVIACGILSSVPSRQAAESSPRRRFLVRL